jgi:hypothetical protein
MPLYIQIVAYPAVTRHMMGVVYMMLDSLSGMAACNAADQWYSML